MAPDSNPGVSGGAYKITIKDRQNSTWQGTVTRIDTGETQSFRSEMELMRLIESSLEAP